MSDPSLLHCGSCKIQSKSVERWVDHLRSGAHQYLKKKGRSGSTGGMHGWDPNRTLRISKVWGIPPKNIVEYLSEWGHVQDFSYLSRKNGATNECHALIHSMDVLSKIIGHPGSHVLKGKVIVMKRAGPIQRAEKPIHLNPIPPPPLSNSIFFCEGCAGSASVSLPGWLQHLSSDSHQLRHRKTQHLRKTEWDLSRKVMINRIQGIQSLNILKYLANWGYIQDFSYLASKDGGTSVAYCLYRTKESAESLVEKKVHCVEGRNVEITLIRQDQKDKWHKFRDNLISKAQHPNRSFAPPSQPQKIEKARVLDEYFIPGQPEFCDQRGSRSEFECKSCCYEAGNVENWLEHLCSSEHRKSKASGGLKNWSNKNGIRLAGILKIPRREILLFARSFGPVLDFIYAKEEDGTSEHCHILFNSSEVVDQILNPKRFLVIGSVSVAANPLPDYVGFGKKGRRKLLAQRRYQEQAFLIEASADPENENLSSLLSGLKLQEQIQQFMKQVGWTDEFLKRSQDMVKEDLKVLLSKTSIKTAPKMFGSIITKTGLKSNLRLQLLLDTEDIDCKCKGELEGCTQKIELLKSVVHDLQTKLRNVTESHNLLPGRIWIDSLSLSDGSTVPECCFSDLGSQSVVSIRFGNILPVQESILINLYARLDPRVLPMLVIITYWAEFHQALIVPDQLFTNQGILLLIIFFLQYKKIVPTVDQLQNLNNSSSKLVRGFDVSFCTDLSTIGHKQISMLEDKEICALSLLSLLKEFFIFFASVDLESNVFCTRLGMTFPKEHFSPENVGKLPGDLARLYRYGRDGQLRSRVLCSGTPVCIQDPFDLTLNLSKSLVKSDGKKFQSRCRQSATTLEEMSMEKPDLLKIFAVLNFENEETCPKRAKMECTGGDGISEKNEDEDWDSWYNVDGGKKTFLPSSSTCLSNVREIPKLSRMSTLDSTPNSSAVMGKDDDFESQDWKGEESEVEEEEETGEDGDRDDLYVSFDLNGPLFRYFERNFCGSKEVKYQKLQTLVLQFILEFNVNFWTNCLGLVFEPKKGQKFWVSDYAKMGSGDVSTLEERLAQIDLDENAIDLEFRVRAENEINKILCHTNESLMKGVNKFVGGPLLTELNVLLRNEEPESTAVKESAFIPVTSKNQVEFEGRLTGCRVPIHLHKASVARLQITAVAKPEMEPKIKLMKRLCRKLGQSYFNRMVKQWLNSCKDFNRKVADTNQQQQHKKWNRKAKSKNKRKGQKKRIGKKCHFGDGSGIGGNPILPQRSLLTNPSFKGLAMESRSVRGSSGPSGGLLHSNSYDFAEDVALHSNEWVENPGAAYSFLGQQNLRGQMWNSNPWSNSRGFQGQESNPSVWGASRREDLLQQPFQGQNSSFQAPQHQQRYVAPTLNTPYHDYPQLQGHPYNIHRQF